MAVAVSPSEAKAALSKTIPRKTISVTAYSSATQRRSCTSGDSVENGDSVRGGILVRFCFVMAVYEWRRE